MGRRGRGIDVAEHCITAKNQEKYHICVMFSLHCVAGSFVVAKVTKMRQQRALGYLRFPSPEPLIERTGINELCDKSSRKREMFIFAMNVTIFGIS